MMRGTVPLLCQSFSSNLPKTNLILFHPGRGVPPVKCSAHPACGNLPRQPNPFVLFILTGFAAAICSLAARCPAQDVLTHHNDFYRSGVQSLETQLTPETVAPATF